LIIKNPFLKWSKVIEAIHASDRIEALGVQPRPSKDDDLEPLQKRISVSLSLAFLSASGEDLLAQVDFSSYLNKRKIPLCKFFIFIL